MIVSGEAMAEVNYCAVSKEYSKNCKEYRESIPFLGRLVDGGEFAACYHSSNTYKVFLKSKSK